MNTEEMAQKAAGLVPEVYVDLIRRVTPGTITVAFVLITAFGRNLAKLTQISQVTQGMLFLLLVLAGYVVGLLIDCISGGITTQLLERRNRVSRRYQRFLWGDLWGDYIDQDTEKGKRLRAALGFGKDLLPETGWQMLLRDYAITSSEYAGRIIPKMIAEEFLLKNLACACLVMGLSNNQLRTSLVFWSLFLFILWAGFFYRPRRTSRRIKVLFELAARGEKTQTRGSKRSHV